MNDIFANLFAHMKALLLVFLFCLPASRSHALLRTDKPAPILHTIFDAPAAPTPIRLPESALPPAVSFAMPGHNDGSTRKHLEIGIYLSCFGAAFIAGSVAALIAGGREDERNKQLYGKSTTSGADYLGGLMMIPGLGLFILGCIMTLVCSIKLRHSWY